MEATQLGLGLFARARRGELLADVEEQPCDRSEPVKVEALKGAASVEHRASRLPEGTRLLGAGVGHADRQFERAEPCGCLAAHDWIFAPRAASTPRGLRGSA